MPIRVSTPVGESVVVEKVYRSCLVNFVGSNTYVDLVILEMVDFDVIMGMTWLSPQFLILDCNAKTVTLAKPGLCTFENCHPFSLQTKPEHPKEMHLV